MTCSDSLWFSCQCTFSTAFLHRHPCHFYVQDIIKIYLPENDMLWQPLNLLSIYLLNSIFTSVFLPFFCIQDFIKRELLHSILFRDFCHFIEVSGIKKLCDLTCSKMSDEVGTIGPWWVVKCQAQIASK